MDDTASGGDDSSYSEGENACTNEEQNMLLYNEAIKLKIAGKLDKALKYFTKCLEGVDAANPFAKLPHCLREIAGIYYDKEDYEKAVQFAQAEKLYYEAALIDSASTMPSKDLSRSNEQLQQSSNDQYVQKANEYEQLASFCLKQHKIHLALEYCGKVAKIRQLILGPSNPATIRSLDMFTVLYAKAGRQQYADALRVTRDSVKDDGRVATDVKDPDHQQKICERNCDESEESVASKVDVTEEKEASKEEVTTDSIDNRTTVQNSSIMHNKRLILFYFLFTGAFAVILSFWITW